MYHFLKIKQPVLATGLSNGIPVSPYCFNLVAPCKLDRVQMICLHVMNNNEPDTICVLKEKNILRWFK